MYIVGQQRDVHASTSKRYSSNSSSSSHCYNDEQEGRSDTRVTTEAVRRALHECNVQLDVKSLYTQQYTLL